MANLGQEYNVADLPESSNYDPLPAGWYTACITQAEIKATKAGTGEYIRIRYDITGPSHQGRVVFANINIRNASLKAEEIGRQQLGELMRAIGLARVSDTDQLINGSLSIKIDIRESPDYGAQNEVKGFRALAESAPPSAQPKAEAKTAPPWAKK